MTKARFTRYSDSHSGTPILCTMTNSIEQSDLANAIERLDQLEEKISELIDLCRSLREENTRIKREFAESDAQRAQLLTKNENASEQVREAVETLQQFSNSS